MVIRGLTRGSSGPRPVVARPGAAWFVLRSGMAAAEPPSCWTE